MAQCCVLSCSNAGEFRVTKTQIDAAKTFHAHPRKDPRPTRPIDLNYREASTKLVCACHAFDVLTPHVEDLMKAATSKQVLQPRDFIHDLTCALLVAGPRTPPRAPRPPTPPRAPRTMRAAVVVVGIREEVTDQLRSAHGARARYHARHRRRSPGASVRRPGSAARLQCRAVPLSRFIEGSGHFLISRSDARTHGQTPPVRACPCLSKDDPGIC